MNLFFTSDSHFWHKNIIQFCNRPFRDVEEMNETMIRNWNNVVGKDDFVYHVGDFFYRGSEEQCREMLHRLQGQIYFIRGNHDQTLDKVIEADKFRGEFKDKVLGISDYLVIEPFGQKIVLFHFPIQDWLHALRGSWHIHGHVHGGLHTKPQGKRLDAAVELWDYTPVSYAQVKKFMDAAPPGDFVQFTGMPKVEVK